MPIIIDAHQDIAWNMLTYHRDYVRSAHETRQLEKNTQIPAANNGDCTLGWPEYQQGQVALIFSTLFVAPMRAKAGNSDRLVYRDANEAVQLYQRNLDVYTRLTDEHPDKFRMVFSQSDMESILTHWQSMVQQPENDLGERPASGHPVGLVLLMEGAEAIREPSDLEQWWEKGLRIIGPAWAGNQYTGGTREPGPLTKAGQNLIGAMADIGYALDISHMDPPAAAAALDIYEGPVLASHANPAALLKDSGGNRHLPDDVIQALVEHDGVIGIVPFNGFLIPDWNRSLRNSKEQVTLQDVVAHIDYVCQIAGDAQHVALGTDFDGGFGYQGVPAEIDTIADLQKLEPLLAEKGYTEGDIEAIFNGNWQSLLKRVLP